MANLPQKRIKVVKKSTVAAGLHSTSSAFGDAVRELREPRQAFPNVSGRWLLSAALVVALGAGALAWLTLCLLFWQGNWQLLYHPATAITRTPAGVGLAFEPVRFAATETGTPQLAGWWIPGESGARTVLYLHGADGDLSDTVNGISALHEDGVAILAFDYRNYGQSVASRPPRPSEKQLRQDAEWALTYLTLTRHVDPKQIVIYGVGLGADLAAEFAADHAELAGVILEQPESEPLAVILKDSRSRFVPAYALVADGYDLPKAARLLKIPSLWLVAQTRNGAVARGPEAYQAVMVRKSMVFLYAPVENDPNYKIEVSRWLGDL